MIFRRPRKSGLGAVRGQDWARLVLVLALTGLLLALPGRGSAQSMLVPATVQAELLAKVGGYDRNFAARAGSKAVVILVALQGDAESTRAALEMKGALSRLPTVGGLPHEEQLVNFSTPGALADIVRARKAAIVYFGPGFGKQVAPIRDAFSSLDVLTVGAVPEYVPSGIVLGFDLVSGRPKLLVNIVQARQQHVAFPASVLNLMKVYP